jgi:light-regulated signal transduction histidine kinase (bacteriophytochrome)
MNKNQLKIEPTPNSKMISTIWNVIWPFEHYIFKRRINIYLIQNLMPKYQMVADWKLYELVMYNILQNALKYNQNIDGDIVFTMTCKRLRERNSNKL